jgi:hypothetical protein
MALPVSPTAAVACVAVAACGAWPAAAESIDVTPSAPRPGQQVHISVPGCGTGPTAHIAVSTAFTANVTLYGKADTGDADPTIRQELKPGTYPVTAYCGASTVRGKISVTANDRTPAGRDDGTNNWLLFVVAVVIAGVATVFLLGRRRRDLS